MDLAIGTSSPFIQSKEEKFHNSSVKRLYGNELL